MRLPANIKATPDGPCSYQISRNGSPIGYVERCYQNQSWYFYTARTPEGRPDARQAFGEVKTMGRAIRALESFVVPRKMISLSAFLGSDALRDELEREAKRMFREGAVDWPTNEEKV